MTRTVRRTGAVFWLLAISLVLRSLVAPGFMLDTSSESPLGFTITLCGGFDGVTGLGEAAPGQHADHTHHDPALVDAGPDHELEHGLFSTHCAVWAAGGGFIASLQPADFTVAVVPVKAPYAADVIPQYTPDSYYNRQQTRAPPASLII